MPELIPLSEQDMDALAQGLGSIAEKYGIYIQTCGTNGDFARYHIHSSGCMTLTILQFNQGFHAFLYARNARLNLFSISGNRVVEVSIETVCNTLHFGKW